MISRAPRFAGAVAALIAGAVASAPSVYGQVSASSAGLFDAVLRSGVSGMVRDRAGAPQIGVLVELLGPADNVIAKTFTDDRGHYRLPGLAAGLYQVEASTSLYLPTIRPNLRLGENSRAVVNLTLSTLFQALEWLPATPRTTQSPSDDWDWTLRLAANRPLLRMFDPGTLQPTSVGDPALLQEGNGADSTRTQVILALGPRRFGEGGLADQVLFSDGNGGSRSMLFGAQSAANTSGVGRIGATAAYSQQLTPDRSLLTVVTLTDRPQIEGGAAPGSDGLTTLRVRSASTVQLGPVAQLTAGTELAVARMGTGNTAFAGQPFAGLTVHAGSTAIAYNIATAPTMTGADQLQQQAQQDAPAVVEHDGTLYLEQGLHQQLSVTHQAGRWTEEAAVFDDSLDHSMVEGASTASAFAGDGAAVDSDDVLYDPGTGTIAVSGAGYHHAGGVLAMLRDQLDPGTWLSLRYALGEAVSLPGAGPAGQSLTAFATPFTAGHSSMLAVAGGTRVAATGTLIHAGYRWQAAGTLTPISPFDSSLPDAYLSFALRQPLRLHRLGESSGSHVEAIVDVRNLLAQGYRPYISPDGSVVYFAQEQRCIAAGLAFSF